MARAFSSFLSSSSHCKLSYRQRMNTTALNLPVNSITNALSQLLDLQEDSPNNHKFESLISSLQDAHTALTNLQATQQPVQTPPAATSTSTPTPTPPPPLIAKFHPNLILPFVKAIRTLDKDLNLVQDVLRDVEAGMENLDKMVSTSFHFSLRITRSKKLNEFLPK